MKDDILETLLNAQINSQEQAWDKFSSLTLDEKKKLLSDLLDFAASPKNTNKAVVMPNVASVIKRKLNPGIEFNKWYEGWLPSIEAEKRGNDMVRNYFPVPTRVINLRPIGDAEEFLTIGFVFSN